MGNVPKRKARNKSLQLQINDLQKEINLLKGRGSKKQVAVKKTVNKPNLLANLDPAKITEWLTVLSNPAVQELISQWKGKISPIEEPKRRRRRMLF